MYGTMQHNKNRVEWIDVFKGVLIILMIIGHSTSPFVKWIYLFHMPAFMFISGYTAIPGKYPFHKIAFKRVKRILIPYIFWNCCFILIYQSIGNGKLNNVSLFDFLVKTYTVDIGGATWFLLVIFEISIVYEILYCTLKTLKCDRYTPYIAMMIGCIGFSLCNTGHYLPCNFDLALYGLLYYAMGNCFAKENVLELKIPAKPMIIISIVVFIIFGGLYSELMMNWSTRNFVGLMENVVSMICGTYLCYRIAKWICTSRRLTKVISFYGQRTLSILIFHFAIFKLIFELFYLVGFKPQDYVYNLVPDGDYPMEWFVVTIGCLTIYAIMIVIGHQIQVQFMKMRIQLQ